MFNSESISVGGEIIPREIVRRRLENISYEHIVYVDNNMPSKIVNGRVEIQVRHPVPYIITALYNALRYTADEIVKMEYGDDGYGGTMTKLYSLILSLCLMFNIIGCTPATDIEQSAQSGIIAETIQTEASEPSNPREDLEVEIAPGVTSNYGLMRVHFIDVGQADSAFIELGNGQTMQSM